MPSSPLNSPSLFIVRQRRRSSAFPPAQPPRFKVSFADAVIIPPSPCAADAYDSDACIDSLSFGSESAADKSKRESLDELIAGIESVFLSPMNADLNPTSPGSSLEAAARLWMDREAKQTKAVLNAQPEVANTLAKEIETLELMFGSVNSHTAPADCDSTLSYSKKATMSQPNSPTNADPVSPVYEAIDDARFASAPRLQRQLVEASLPSKEDLVSRRVQLLHRATATNVFAPQQPAHHNGVFKAQMSLRRAVSLRQERPKPAAVATTHRSLSVKRNESLIRAGIVTTEL